MRIEDFPNNIKQLALKRANYRCERCWTKKDLEIHHIIPVRLGGKTDLKNCLVFCHNCHNSAPSDSFLLKNIFLRFSSSKEMIQYYKVENEYDALKLLSKEIGVTYEKIKNKFDSDPFSHVVAVKKGMKLKADKEGHCGFNIPFGYEYKEGILQILPDQAKVVQTIYNQYLSGKSMGKIVKMLNDTKIPTKNKGFWAKKMISTILKNPVYCGYHRFEGRITKGKHQKVIDLEIFKKIQKLINEKGGKQKNYNFV
jgi:hypothetical protein